MWRYSCTSCHNRSGHKKQQLTKHKDGGV
ncbi:MAG: hypothetical protein JO235_06235 [Chroococcidiopsidaceae cyanobacterium CP_BM_RX_35]|nr:hypothetical protein [Chroococcidiopsidaceae cyanobacterium CP_BM_RX_35]